MDCSNSSLKTHFWFKSWIQYIKYLKEIFYQVYNDFIGLKYYFIIKYNYFLKKIHDLKEGKENMSHQTSQKLQHLFLFLFLRLVQLIWFFLVDFDFVEICFFLKNAAYIYVEQGFSQSVQFLIFYYGYEARSSLKTNIQTRFLLILASIFLKIFCLKRIYCTKLHAKTNYLDFRHISQSICFSLP